MEFPDLGTQCEESTCARLDFLPFTCDACHKIFCLDHKTYEEHHCTQSYTKDVKVPVCPLCNQPVPISRGDDPNIKMDQHISNDCRVDEEKKKLYRNSCSFKSCKKKELVQVNCNTCHKRFCLKHRFETDHNCSGPPGRIGSSSRSPRISTSHQRNPQSTTLTGIGADLNKERLARHKQQQNQSQQHRTPPHSSADHALATALAASLHEPHPLPSEKPCPLQDTAQIEEDEALARAIAESLQHQQNQKAPEAPAGSSSNACNVS